MKKIFIILAVLITFSHCSFNKVIKKHGVRNLENKQKQLSVNISNSNDIKQLLGPPSTTSAFDNNLWIYIERELTNEKLIKLGKEKLLRNNVLVIELDGRGILVSKNFYDINEMQEIDFSKLSTENKFSKKSFVYDFLSSMRQKINDPLGKRK
jgi:outer membrane protein assembly factor BamE (lipoprotein component of BamABCDE complex)